MPATQHVQVQVVHRLTAVYASVHHHAKACGCMFPADFSGSLQQVSQHFGIVVFNVRKRRNLALWNDENVHGCDRRNVMEGQAQVVFENLTTG